MDIENDCIPLFPSATKASGHKIYKLSIIFSYNFTGGLYSDYFIQPVMICYFWPLSTSSNRSMKPLLLVSFSVFQFNYFSICLKLKIRITSGT